MSSPRLTTVLLPPAKGTSIGDNRVASPPGREAGRAGATTKLGKIRSPQMGSIQRPLTRGRPAAQASWICSSAICGLVLNVISSGTPVLRRRWLSAAQSSGR